MASCLVLGVLSGFFLSCSDYIFHLLAREMRVGRWLKIRMRNEISKKFLIFFTFF